LKSLLVHFHVSQLVFKGLLQDGLIRFQSEVVSFLPVEVSCTGVYDVGVEVDISLTVSSVDTAPKMIYLDVASQFVQEHMGVIRARGAVANVARPRVLKQQIGMRFTVLSKQQ
jgi:hypothetical protein